MSVVMPKKAKPLSLQQSCPTTHGKRLSKQLCVEVLMRGERWRSGRQTGRWGASSPTVLAQTGHGVHCQLTHGHYCALSRP